MLTRQFSVILRMNSVRRSQTERERERFLYEKIDNPLSDTSTWNTELPNIGNLLLRLGLRLSDLQIIETF